MKALVVPQPIANDVMLGQQALLAFFHTNQPLMWPNF